MSWKRLKNVRRLWSDIAMVLIIGFPGISTVCAQHHLISSGPGLDLSAGFAFSRMTDMQFSSQVYSGFTPLLAAGAHYAVGLGEHEFNAVYTGGNLSAENPSSPGVRWQYVTLEYGYMRQMGAQNGNWDNRLGGSVSFNSSTRKFDGFINLDKNYEKFLGANAIWQSSYQIPGGSGWAITGRIMTSLCTYLSQALTGINNPPESGNGAKEDGGKMTSFVFIPELLRLRTFLQIGKTLGDGQKVLLSYAWDAYRIKQEMQVSQASHQLFLTYRKDF